MKNKTARFIAVLSAFMVAGGGSICGSMPVHAAENTTVNATADSTPDAAASSAAAADPQSESVSGNTGDVEETAISDTDVTKSASDDSTDGGTETETESSTAADDATDVAPDTNVEETVSTDVTADNGEIEADTEAVYTAEELAAAAALGVDLTELEDNPDLLSEYLVQLRQMMEQQKKATRSAATKSTSWTGSVLTRGKGINRGPSGKETWYNLNMSRVVATMHRLGYEGDYWVRDDGVKMFGSYVLCAASFKQHKRGSLLETSLGTAIVADTGYFGRNGVAVDIATAW